MKRPESMEKVRLASIKRGNAHMMDAKSRKKAIRAISRALTGRTLTDEHRLAIGRGSKRAGCRPPDNSKTLVGPSHPNWKGGVSTIRNKDRHSPRYITFRDGVLNRDDFTCQTCGNRGGKLHAHHVKSWAEFPDLRYDITNGLTLCVHCHHLAHKGVRRPPVSAKRRLSDLYSNQPAT